MLKVLAIDTATDACSVAVTGAATGAAAGTARSERLGRKHAECLVPMITDVLGETGLGFADLDVLAVTVGPGSFTGLRVGLATARGIALAANLPCLGITTFDAVAATCFAQRNSGAHDALLIVMDTRRGDVYAQVYDGAGKPISAPFVSDFEGVMAHLPPGSLAIAGDAAEPAARCLTQLGRAADIVPVSHPAPDALAALAAERWRAGASAGAGTHHMPRPLYLRPPKTGGPAPVND